MPLSWSIACIWAQHSARCSFVNNATENKKFELMLTGRAKAYSSSCPQAVTHRRTVTSFQPKRVTNVTLMHSAETTAQNEMTFDSDIHVASSKTVQN